MKTYWRTSRFKFRAHLVSTALPLRRLARFHTIRARLGVVFGDASPQLASRIVHVARRRAHRARLIHRHPAFGLLLVRWAPLSLGSGSRGPTSRTRRARAPRRVSRRRRAARRRRHRRRGPRHPGVALDSRRAQAHPVRRLSRHGLGLVPRVQRQRQDRMPTPRRRDHGPPRAPRTRVRRHATRRPGRRERPDVRGGRRRSTHVLSRVRRPRTDQVRRVPRHRRGKPLALRPRRKPRLGPARGMARSEQTTPAAVTQF